MSQRLLITCPDGPYREERRYIVDLLLSEFLGLPYELAFSDRRDTLIQVAGAPEGPALQVGEGLFATPLHRWLTPASLPAPRLARLPVDRLPAGWEAAEPDLPVLFGKPVLVRLAPERWHLGLDLFGGAFFMVTRYEECAIEARDDLERFPSTLSVAAREDLLERPVVNEYVECLWAFLHLLFPAFKRRERHFRLLLTHDVDRPVGAVGWPLQQMVRASLADIFKRRDPRLASHRLLAAVQPPRPESFDADPYNTFDFLMAVSERQGLTGTFNFIAERSAGDRDGRYDLSDPWILRLMRRIHDRGHALGLHPSFLTFRDPGRTAREFETLRAWAEVAGIHQDHWGGRQHFLRWDNPVTWQNWEDAGLTYDSTLGYADRAGFRAGCCYEFPVYNLRTRQRLRLRERPLVVMDGSLFKYMRLSPAAASAVTLRLAETCRRYAGDFTLLWHNSMVVTQAERVHYEQLIAALAGRQAALAVT